MNRCIKPIAQIGIYLTVTTHYVILSEAAQSAAKSKNPFSLRCF